MKRLSHPDHVMSGSISRRRLIGATATASVSVATGMLPHVALGESTPEASPEASPAVTTVARKADSWFVLSEQAAIGSLTTQADRFEVFSGATRQRLGGFRAPGTTGMCVTADPGRILLASQTGLGIFDLESGKVAPVDLGTTPISSALWLPDPRVFPTTPPRWSLVHTLDSTQAWLVDLDHATGVDLTTVLGTKGSTPSFGSIVFSPTAELAAAAVDGAGSSLFDPGHPEKARKLNGGEAVALGGLPSFSASGKRIAYSILSSPTATDGKLVVEDAASKKIILEIGNVSAMTSIMFLPGSETDILITGDGEVARQEIESGREAWSVTTRNFAYAYGFTSDHKKLLYGSIDKIGDVPYWDVIDLDSGDISPLPAIEGLTYYNGSYPVDSAYTLFGPQFISSSQETVDSLVGFDNEHQHSNVLLDNVSSWDLNYGYSNSADGRIALFVKDDANLMNLETGDVQTFPNFATGGSTHGSFVSPDGSLAAISAWDATSGAESVYLIDVTGDGEPELFMPGVIWLWSGQVGSTVRRTDHPLAFTPAASSRNVKRLSPLTKM